MEKRCKKVENRQSPPDDFAVFPPEGAYIIMVKQSEIERLKAVNEFAEKIKTQVYPFLQAKMFNEKCYLTGNPESDIYREQKNQNIGILKAQDILSKWFKVKIDELLKEYNL